MTPEGRANGLAVMTRLAKRRPATESLVVAALAGRLEMLMTSAIEAALEEGVPMGRILAERVAAEATPALAERLMVVCDRADLQDSVELREVALVAIQKTVEDRQKAFPEPTLEQRRRIAFLRLNLANRLSALGRRLEALERSSTRFNLFGMPTPPAWFRFGSSLSLCTITG